MIAIPATTVANLRDLGSTPLSGGRTVRPAWSSAPASSTAWTRSPTRRWPRSG